MVQQRELFTSKPHALVYYAKNFLRGDDVSSTAGWSVIPIECREWVSINERYAFSLDLGSDRHGAETGSTG